MSKLLTVGGSAPESGVLLLNTVEVGGCREDYPVCDVTTSSFYDFIPLWNFRGEFGSGCN